MLNRGGMSHNVAKWCDLERLKQAIDNLPNSQETFVEGQQVRF